MEDCINHLHLYKNSYSHEKTLSQAIESGLPIAFHLLVIRKIGMCRKWFNGERAFGHVLSQYLPIAPQSTRAGLEAAFTEAVLRVIETIQSARKQTPLLLASLTLFFFTVFYILTHRVRVAAWIKLRIPGDYLPRYEKLYDNIGGALHGVI